MKLTPRIIGTGLIRDYLELTNIHEAPPSMHLACLLTTFTAVLERRLRIKRGYNILANLYTILVGPPATRKGFAMKMIEGIFREVDAGCGSVRLEPHYLGKNFTSEAIVTKFSKLEEENMSPAGLILSPELSTSLGKKRYQDDIMQFLMDIYDGGKQKSERRGSGEEEGGYGCKDSWLGILGATTPTSIQNLPRAFINSGMSSRMWLIVEGGVHRLNARPRWDKPLRARIVENLREILMPLMRKDDINFHPTEEAEKFFKIWYEGPNKIVIDRSDPSMQYWTGRRHDHVMRASVLMHLLDGGTPDDMGVEAIKRGIEWIELLEPGIYSVLDVTGQTKWSETRRFALQLVRKRQPMPVRQFKAAIGSRCGRGEGAVLLKELLMDDLVLQDKNGKLTLPRK